MLPIPIMSILSVKTIKSPPLTQFGHRLYRSGLCWLNRDQTLFGRRWPNRLSAVQVTRKVGNRLRFHAFVTEKGLSKISLTLIEGSGVVSTRSNIHWVVTEQGAVNLYGKPCRNGLNCWFQLLTRTIAKCWTRLLSSVLALTSGLSPKHINRHN